MNDYLVQMKGIVKRFPGVLALDHVDFELRPGEVHMLLGENGAGKSTLIKVLSGAYLCDEGEILIKGKKVDIQSPLDALSRDLRFIYQELNLVQQMDVARNMFLGMEPTLVPGLGIVNKRKLYSLARDDRDRESARRQGLGARPGRADRRAGGPGAPGAF
jgi:ABC-type sugar transport system ATPase subunit